MEINASTNCQYCGGVVEWITYDIGDTGDTWTSPEQKKSFFEHYKVCDVAGPAFSSMLEFITGILKVPLQSWE